jgi:DNA-binding NtrC family response regulator
MDKEEALNIIKMIANGEDPYKDEKPAKYLPEHNPKTLKALCKMISYIFPTEIEGNDTINRQPLILSNFINKPIEQFFKNLEKDAIVNALTRCLLKENNAAEMLGISYHDLQDKINEHKIDISAVEKESIFQALAEAEWDKNKASELLRITFDKLEQKIDQHGIGKEIFIKALLMAVEQDYYKLLNNIDLVQLLEKIEKNAIIKSLEKSRDNKNEAAKRLKISFRSLRYRIAKLQIGHWGEVDNWIKSDYFKFYTDISLDEFLKIIEKKLVELALKENQYNQNRASEKLGITFRSIRYRIDNLGIKIS